MKFTINYADGRKQEVELVCQGQRQERYDELDAKLLELQLFFSNNDTLYRYNDVLDFSGDHEATISEEDDRLLTKWLEREGDMS